MSKQSGEREYYSGVPWVYVTPQEARNHPLGRPGLIIWGIATCFIVISVLKFWWLMGDGAGIASAFLNSIWPFLAGVGLMLRVPWAVFLAIVPSALTLYLLVRGMGSSASIYYLLETILHVGILFYLIDADRPNLIYRHRYRKYSAAEAGDAPDKSDAG